MADLVTRYGGAHTTLPDPFDYFEFAKELTRAHADALLHGSQVGCLSLSRRGPYEGFDAESSGGLGCPVASSAAKTDTSLPSRPVLRLVEDNT